MKDGIKKCIDDAINIGKGIKGIVTGKFDNINHMQEIVKLEELQIMYLYYQMT